MNLTEFQGKALLSVQGPVRLGETVELHAVSLAAVDTGLDVLVELKDAEHLHAAAVQVLRALEIHLEKSGRAFVVRGASEGAAAALVLAGLSRWLNRPEELS